MLKLQWTNSSSKTNKYMEKDKNKITFLYAVVGKGTEEYSKLKEGDYINLTGPLGNGFDLSKRFEGKVAIVCGGIGTAPMVEVSKKLREKNKMEL